MILAFQRRHCFKGFVHCGEFTELTQVQGGFATKIVSVSFNTPAQTFSEQHSDTCTVILFF